MEAGKGGQCFCLNSGFATSLPMRPLRSQDQNDTLFENRSKLRPLPVNSWMRLRCNLTVEVRAP